jgi:hypothetical protein
MHYFNAFDREWVILRGAFGMLSVALISVLFRGTLGVGRLHRCI